MAPTFDGHDLKLTFFAVLHRWVDAEKLREDFSPVVVDTMADDFKADFFDALEQIIPTSSDAPPRARVIEGVWQLVTDAKNPDLSREQVLEGISMFQAVLNDYRTYVDSDTSVHD
jgi:hypothetical protein